MQNVSQWLYGRSPVPLQTLLLNGYAAKMHRRQFTRKFAEQLEKLMESQWWSHDQLKSYQDERVQAIIKHAWTFVPYYRRLMKERNLAPSDIKNVSDLWKLPILTRDVVRRYHRALISERSSRWTLIHGHTSGTTGSPLQFVWDRHTCIVNNALDWRQKHWAGLKYGDPFAVLLGRMIVPQETNKTPFWRMNYLHNQLWLSSFHMNSDNLPHYIKKLTEFRPIALEGYPSTIYILARYLESRGEKFPLRAVLTSSEPLLPSHRELMESVFECKVFDFYSLAERVIFATECDHHTGHHLNLEYGITEVVDENNLPCSPGKLGRLVCTSLHNYAMPFIRYQTSDITALKKEACSCGRVFPLLESIVTKDEDIIVAPDGRLISPSVITHIFKPLHHVVESQVIQEDIQNIRVNLVTDERYNHEDTRHLIQGFRERVGNEVRVRVEFVDKIQRTSAGKCRWVISKVALPF